MSTITTRSVARRLIGIVTVVLISFTLSAVLPVAYAEQGGEGSVQCSCPETSSVCAGPVDCSAYNGNGWTCSPDDDGFCDYGMGQPYAWCYCFHPVLGGDYVPAAYCLAFVDYCIIH